LLLEHLRTFITGLLCLAYPNLVRIVIHPSTFAQREPTGCIDVFELLPSMRQRGPNGDFSCHKTSDDPESLTSLLSIVQALASSPSGVRTRLPRKICNCISRADLVTGWKNFFSSSSVPKYAHEDKASGRREDEYADAYLPAGPFISHLQTEVGAITK
jgi:hypothetical protein